MTDGASCWKAVTVEGRGAETAGAEVCPVGERVIEDHGAVVDHGDVFAGDLLAELAGEHGAVAIDGVAIGCGEEIAHETACDLWSEDDGAASAWERGARIEAP